MFTVPVAFAAWLAWGSRTERGTEGSAASWKTTSQPRTAATVVSGSRLSPSIRSIPSRIAASGSEVLILDDLSTGRRRNVEHLLDEVASNGHARARVELIEGSTSDVELVDELIGSVDRCFHLASAVGVELVVDRPLDSL